MNVIPQAVRLGFTRLIRPLAQLFVRLHIRPNTITTIGTLVVLMSAVAFARGHLHWGGFLLLLSGVFDMLDGQVARDGGARTRFGAFYDSTLDRVGETALFTGIAIYFLQGGVAHERLNFAVVACCAALGGSLLVSYTRARAESLDIECNTGIATRAERILLLGAPALVFGPGNRGTLLMWIVVALALAAAITVVQRVVHVARATSVLGPGAPRAARTRDTQPGHAPALQSRKGR
jgi:CDP-diacylglycerol---glycerol-3-phosphate 3-phosphatidyltransferase